MAEGGSIVGGLNYGTVFLQIYKNVQKRQNLKKTGQMYDEIECNLCETERCVLVGRYNYV